MNNLPKCWCVHSMADTALFLAYVMPYINSKQNSKLQGNVSAYYGRMETGVYTFFSYPSSFGKDVVVLTIQEFIKLLEPMENKYEIPIPEGKQVDKVEVKENSINLILKDIRKSFSWKNIAKGTRRTVYYVSDSSNIYDTCSNLSGNDSQRNYVNTEKQAEKVRALSQLFMIMDAANDEISWTPNSITESWGFTYNKGKETLELGSLTLLKETICFKTRELAEQAYADNKEIFDTFYKP